MSGNLAYLDPIPGERWVTVKGFEDYEVSDRGRVRSYKTLHRKHGRAKVDAIRSHVENNGITKATAWLQPTMLKLHSSPTTPGYYAKMVLLYSENSDARANYMINRLVYENFVGPILEGMDVCHKNEDETDDRPDNLYLRESSLRSLAGRLAQLEARAR